MTLCCKVVAVEWYIWVFKHPRIQVKRELTREYIRAYDNPKFLHTYIGCTVHVVSLSEDSI